LSFCYFKQKKNSISDNNEKSELTTQNIFEPRSDNEPPTDKPIYGIEPYQKEEYIIKPYGADDIPPNCKIENEPSKAPKKNCCFLLLFCCGCRKQSEAHTVV
jgi:hypothetical protein